MDTNLKEIVNYCVDRILEQKENPLFIAIAGDSGSGKSFYAELIKKELERRKITCTYVDHDDFLIPRKDREPMKKVFYTEGEYKGKSHWELLENMFYLDKYEKVITDLRQGKQSSYYPYSREIGDIATETKTVSPNRYVLFDTSMMLEKMDFIILIDVPQETIIKRKLERDSDVRTPEQITEMHKKVQGYYWERKRPKSADIVIDNSDLNNPKVLKL